MIGSQFLSHCKPGVRIVNVARGGLLDYEAVRVGLDSGRIAGLGLDVQEHEPVDPQHWLAQHPRLVVLYAKHKRITSGRVRVCRCFKSADGGACLLKVVVFWIRCSVYLTPHIAGVTEMSCKCAAGQHIRCCMPTIMSRLPLSLSALLAVPVQTATWQRLWQRRCGACGRARRRPGS
jgi:lactate dehydrogenase-like 2-hydroxyacid dehydrogenase